MGGWGSDSGRLGAVTQEASLSLSLAAAARPAAATVNQIQYQLSTVNQVQKTRYNISVTVNLALYTL